MGAENEHFAALELEDRVLLSSLGTRLNLPETRVAVGRFVLTRRLGRGGMGTVYEARDPERSEAVALKMLANHLPGAAHRMKREFRAAADIHHPNLVQLYEFDFYERRPYFTMELVEGTDIVTRAGRKSSLSAAEGWQHLRTLLAQLASALDMLHTHGRVHGDVKASNVMVTPEHRVVLLDFGLARFSALLELEHTQSKPGGTPGYMAPELAAGEATSASDWYAFGVLLHVLLTSRMPVNGRCVPELADVTARDHELVALVPALLRPEPEQRPASGEILEVLGLRASSIPVRLDDELVGRDAELRELHDLHRQMMNGTGTLAAFVRGPSGIGKSALVRAFLQSLQLGRHDVVLSGRCYERETLPFKSLDGIVDSLARHLQRLSPELVAHLLPRHIHALAQLFPRLGEVPVVAASPPAATLPDRQEVRRCAALALKDLLNRLADVAPLVVWIDDLQWGDADSLTILRDVLRPPDAPRLLLILSHRSEHAVPTTSLRSLYDLVSEDARAMRVIEVGPLLPEEGRRFARSLLPGTDAHVDGIVHEAQGHPLFIRELCSVVATHPCASKASLEQLLRDRIESLPERARALLASVALARGPVRWRCAAMASGVDETSMFFELSNKRLIRTIGSDGGAEDLVETFHDRVRDVVFALLDQDQRRDGHRRLARSFQQLGNPEAIAWHYIEGDEPQAALPWLVRAADLAAQSLANDRAIRLYRAALDIETVQAERVELLAKLGDAARGTGRAEEAADAYLEAANFTTDGTRARELKRLALHELLRCGLNKRARFLLHELLGGVGIGFPQSNLSAVVALLIQMIWLRLRGFRFRELKLSQVPARQIERIDVCWSISHALGHADVIRSAVFMQRATALALRAGEASRVGRALAVTVQGISALRPYDSRLPHLISEARAIEGRGGDPYLRALIELAEAHIAFNRCQLPASLKAAEEASRLLREECTGVPHDATHADLLVVSMLDQLGRIPEFQARVLALRQQARDRGDFYSGLIHEANAARADIYVDAPDDAEKRLDSALTMWMSPRFQLTHCVIYFTRICLLQYVERPLDAFATALWLWRTMRRNMAHKHVLVGVLAAAHVGRTATAAFGSTGDERYLRASARALSRLRAAKCPLAPPFIDQVEGLTALHSGKRELAEQRLAVATSAFQQLNMSLWAEATRVQLGRCRGDKGGELQGLRALKECGVANPNRVAMMHAPGWPQ